ncbi:FMN-dependent NADH-azoreductase [Chryseomicrobium palamuruense]|uniref:FMN dependent NADH:quinone oxidoreductase n=1 Tax=Chryseomicrobium palamuruense TaxID=682973 RepID=A0ABV8USY4_9BACL
MTNVLVVKANNRPDGISTKMYNTFMETVKGNTDMNVRVFDVFEEDMPYFGQDLFNAFGKMQNEEELSDVERRIMAAKQKAMDAVKEADILVFAFPLWNLTIPAALQTFIDYVYSVGFTFKYDAQGNLVQLMPEKKVILLNARGGLYSAPEMVPMEMSYNYMQNVFHGVFGMQIIENVIIEGHNANPQQAEAIVEAGIQRVQEVAQKLVAQYA